MFHEEFGNAETNWPGRVVSRLRMAARDENVSSKQRIKTGAVGDPGFALSEGRY